MWLFNFLDEELGDAVLQANTNSAPKDMSEHTLLLSIKALAVKNESKLVHRIKLGRAFQPSGVPIRNHLSTLKGMDRQCEYAIQCTHCNTLVDFSREVIQDQIIGGLNDLDIVSELLGDVTVNRTLEEVIEFIRYENGYQSIEGGSVWSRPNHARLWVSVIVFKPSSHSSAPSDARSPRKICSAFAMAGLQLRKWLPI